MDAPVAQDQQKSNASPADLATVAPGPWPPKESREAKVCARSDFRDSGLAVLLQPPQLALTGQLPGRSQSDGTKWARHRLTRNSLAAARETRKSPKARCSWRHSWGGNTSDRAPFSCKTKNTPNPALKKRAASSWPSRSKSTSGAKRSYRMPQADGEDAKMASWLGHNSMSLSGATAVKLCTKGATCQRGPVAKKLHGKPWLDLSSCELKSSLLQRRKAQRLWRL